MVIISRKQLQDKCLVIGTNLLLNLLMSEWLFFTLSELYSIYIMARISLLFDNMMMVSVLY